MAAIAIGLFGLMPTRFAVPTGVHTSATVQFRTSGVVATPDIHPAAADLRLASLAGHVGINETHAGSPELDALNRRTLLPRLLLTYIVAFIVTDLLWRLCRNIERNDVFIDANLTLVRLLGVVVAVREPITTFLGRWSDFQLSEFALRHVAFTGLTVEPPHFDIAANLLLAVLNNLGGLITGLLIFTVAEVFRQGLVLKQEADLTV